jgi:hypothetical protein
MSYQTYEYDITDLKNTMVLQVIIVMSNLSIYTLFIFYVYIM